MRLLRQAGSLAHAGPVAPSPGSARRGLTLLEVVVSLAIFLFSLAAITHLISLSSQNVMMANLRSQAGLMCQSKLAELLSGAIPFDSSGYASFPENPEWQWKVESQANSDVQGLYNVEVFVKKDREQGPPVEVSLRQMVFNPSFKGSTLDPPPGSSSSGGS